MSVIEDIFDEDLPPDVRVPVTLHRVSALLGNARRMKSFAYVVVPFMTLSVVLVGGFDFWFLLMQAGVFSFALYLSGKSKRKHEALAYTPVRNEDLEWYISMMKKDAPNKVELFKSGITTERPLTYHDLLIFMGKYIHDNIDDKEHD